MKIKFLTIITCLLISSFAFTQQKFGHINVEQILTIMPEAVTAELALQQEVTELQAQLQTMQEELQSKFKDYELNQNTMSEAVRKDKETNLQNLQQRILTFEQTAQQSLTTKQNQLLEPVLQKLQDAINKVAAEKGYAYIFNVTDMTSTIIFSDDSFDITDEVKTKLKL